MNTVNQLEEWFLDKLEQPEIDMRALSDKLSELARNEQTEEANSFAVFVEEALAEKGRTDEALRILRLRANWSNSTEFRKVCASSAQNILGKSQESRAFVKNCGFEQRIPVSECLDRLVRLRSLKVGALCFDKTWGFGIVKGSDPFYERVTVDFDKKKGHELAMGYAAETLELLDAKHILAVKHADPEGLAALVKDDPAQVVRMALRSYGPLNAVILQEKLSPSLVPAADWKKFWDSARKTLKGDSHAVVPTKRTEPILLKEAAEAYDDAWFQKLQHDRDIESILAKISDWVALGAHKQAEAGQLAVVENRMAFVIKGADLMGRTVMPRAMMLAHAVGVLSEKLGVGAYVRDVLDTEKLLDLLSALSARDMKAFIAFLMAVDRQRTLDTLLRLLPRLDVSSLGEVLQLLINEGEEEACRQAIKALINARRAQVELLSWLSRNMDKLAAWDLCAPAEFAEVVLLEMEKDYTGLRLKAQNQLRDRFTQKTWVKDLFDQLGPQGRERYFARLKDTSAWPTMEKRSVLGHIIKLYPDLERLMVAKAGDPEQPVMARGPVTSMRSYRERQLLYERIKTVDIPNNSKEIATARAHGDLRENFEFKSAKETQGLLMRRQGELEQMLGLVMPTDFENVPVDKAGIGTGVRIEYEDGRSEQFYVLGVWDRDEALGIISCESKLAQALEGHTPGDRVTVPTEHGETTCRIVEVSALPEPVLAWLRDIPESLEGRAVGA